MATLCKCLVPDCGRDVDDTSVFCLPHWLYVPPDIRAVIVEPGEAVDVNLAIAAAVAIIDVEENEVDDDRGVA